MLKHFVRALTVIAIGTIASAAMTNPGAANPGGSPLGTWTVENGHGVVAIAPCGDALCGRIVGIDRKPTEPMPTDVHGRSQCGLTIITNQKPKPDGTWMGEITDPRDGSKYQSTLRLDEQGNLLLRGFIGIPLLGSTQVWRPFTGHLTSECGLA